MVYKIGECLLWDTIANNTRSGNYCIRIRKRIVYHAHE